jgi:transposase
LQYLPKAVHRANGGIRKGHRTTERLARDVLHKSERFVALKGVEKNCGVSSGYVFRAAYRMLELKRRMHNQYPWPSTIGLDEQSFRKNKGHTEFVSVFVDFKNHRFFEVVDGKSEDVLKEKLEHVPGRENVKNVGN